MKFLPALLLALALPVSAKLTPERLRCEAAANPLGVDLAHPRLSWNFSEAERGQRQTAYQILVATSAEVLAADRGDLWDSGQVSADETLHIAYAGKDLASSLGVFWKVRAWDANGKPSAWSKPATWTMGVLNPADWAGAKWIGVTDTNVPNVLLRREFTVKPGLRRALVHVTGLGQFELTLNGRKVGENVLSPGWSKYDKTVLYETHDVTAALKRGANAVGLSLGNGMYNVVTGGRFAKFKKSFGGQCALAQLRLEYADGTVETVVTDGDWRQGSGPNTFNSIYGGEDCDARLQQPGWDSAGFNEAGKWAVAQVVSGPGGELKGLSCSAPPLHDFEVHPSVAARVLTNGDVVYDFGQNASHRPRVTVSGPAGSKVRLTPSELVGDDGAVDQKSMGAGRRGALWCEYTKATDGAETWMPQFFYVGCRYVQVHLTPAVTNGALPKVKAIAGVVVHSASEPVGEFECSNGLFNRIRKLVRWAQRSNMVSLMTDCPHREKLGWLEEDHLNGPALRYEFNLDQLFTKTLNDIADSQLTNGLVPTTAPEYTIFADKTNAVYLRNHFGDSPEWSATFTLVPWQQYEFSGDLELFRLHFDAMKRYVENLGSRATNHIVDYGLGDWYDLGPAKPGVSQLTPRALTATAFYFENVKYLARAAALIGRPHDAKELDALAQEIRQAFNQKFYDAAQGSYATGSQCANSIPLVMGLCEPTNRAAVLAAIVRDVRARTNSLTAGDVGYRYLLRALADGGRSDVIFDINNRTDKPGYGMQLAKGKTSLTEAWDGGASQNHFMLGQIQEWFYHDLVGIRPGGNGFKEIVIAPQPVGDVTHAKASYQSARGEIEVKWQRGGGKFDLEFTLPPNTTGMVFVPVKAGGKVTESGKAAGEVRGVKFLREADGCAVFAVESGEFHFVSALD